MECGSSSLICDPQPLLVSHVETEQTYLTAFYGKVYSVFNRALSLSNEALVSVKDSQQEDHIGWKLDKYSTLLTQLKKEMTAYIQELGYASLEMFIEHPQPREEWECLLIPIIELFVKKISLEDTSYTVERLNYLRDCYKNQFLCLLREAVAWTEQHEHKAGREHIFACCHLLYTKINLNAYCMRTLDFFCKAGLAALGASPLAAQGPSEKHYFLIQDLERIHQSITKVSYAIKGSLVAQSTNSLIGHMGGLGGVPFDSNSANPIHVFTELVIKQNGKEKRIANVAMGTPTIEKGGELVANIAPEFLGYQQANKSKGQSQLYINYQNFIPKARWRGNETPRSQAIHNLGEKPDLTNIFVVTISKDTSFYWQNLSSITSRPAKNFKNELFHQFFELTPSESGNYIPELIVKQLNLKDWTKETLEQMHQTLFEGKENLTLTEMRVWNDMFDIILSLKLMLDLKVDYYNKSCKDRIDRGAAADALLFTFLAILNQVESDKRVKDFFEMMIFSRSIMVRKRTIMTNRLSRLIETAKWMLDHKEYIRQLYKNLFPEIEITTTTFLHLNNQNESSKAEQSFPIPISEFLLVQP